METNNSVIGTFRMQPKGFRAFIPGPFPPVNRITFSPRLIQKATRASMLIGKLDGVTHLLPDVDFFLSMYVRKDATSSSQIEGTQATMIDAIDADSGNDVRSHPDVDDILHYIHALKYGFERIKDFPMSLRFLCELHERLMRGARTTHFADPGSFRRSQNWIGGTSPANAHFVPPPPEELTRCLSDLENSLHAQDDYLPIIKAGLLHAQFETIHPFLDGNGRTGRMLITFYLWMSGLLERPVLFLSSYLNKHKKVYYDRLDGYHEGKVDAWLDFFLDGVIETAEAAIETACNITALREADTRKIQSLGKTAATTTMQLLLALFQQPIITASKVQEWTGFSRPGAQKAIDRLVDLGILELRDERKYGRSYIYRRYVDIFID